MAASRSAASLHRDMLKDERLASQPTTMTDISGLRPPLPRLLINSSEQLFDSSA